MIPTCCACVPLNAPGVTDCNSKLNTNSAFVDGIYGNDDTAVLRSDRCRYQTISAAFLAVRAARGPTEEWIININPGTYDALSLVGVSGISFVGLDPYVTFIKTLLVFPGVGFRMANITLIPNGTSNEPLLLINSCGCDFTNMIFDSTPASSNVSTVIHSINSQVNISYSSFNCTVVTLPTNPVPVFWFTGDGSSPSSWISLSNSVTINTSGTGQTSPSAFDLAVTLTDDYTAVHLIANRYLINIHDALTNDVFGIYKVFVANTTAPIAAQDDHTFENYAYNDFAGNTVVHHVTGANSVRDQISHCNYITHYNIGQITGTFKAGANNAGSATNQMTLSTMAVSAYNPGGIIAPSVGPAIAPSPGPAMLSVLPIQYTRGLHAPNFNPGVTGDILTANGGIASTGYFTSGVVTITGDLVIADNDQTDSVLVNGLVIVTLPPTILSKGRIIKVTLLNTTSTASIVTGIATDSIIYLGAISTFYSLSSANGKYSVEFVSDGGGNWVVTATT
jgi:hypothetical protein